MQLGVGPASGFAAAILGVCYLLRYQRIRVRVNGRSLKVTFDVPANGLRGEGAIEGTDLRVISGRGQER
jgi:hypothetical protein